MDSKNVSFGKPKATGAVFLAPIGTAIPEDASAELDPGFKNLGYISEDGLVVSTETDTSNIKAWGGDTVLAAATSYAETFTVNLLETNEQTMKLIYGDENVTGVFPNLTIKSKSGTLPEHILVFETVLTGGRIRRIVVPRAQIVDRSGELSYTDGEAIVYPAKFNAYPDASGDYHREYIAAAG